MEIAGYGFSHRENNQKYFGADQAHLPLASGIGLGS